MFLAGRAANTFNTLWDFDSGSTLDYYKTTNPTSSDATIARFDITSILIGINENEDQDSELILFPNPSSDFINIEFVKQTKSNFEIILTDALGRTIVRKKYDKTEKNIKFDIHELSNGLYFVHLNSPEVQATGKFIKIN